MFCIEYQVRPLRRKPTWCPQGVRGAHGPARWTAVRGEGRAAVN